MKSKKLITILLVVAIILVSICIAVFIIKSNDLRETDTDYDTEETDSSEKDEKSSEKEDSFQGSVIIFEPDVEDFSKVSAKDMDSAEAIIRARLDAKNYVEATISRQGKTGIRVEIPGIYDPHEALEMIGATAKLEFLDADGNVLMDGSKENIKSAEALYGHVSEDGENIHYIQLFFTKEGQKKFAEATEAAVNAEVGKNIISIALDGIVQMSPTVNEVINADTCIITGDYTGEEAEKIATLINSGALPFSLKDVELRTVNPQQ